MQPTGIGPALRKARLLRGTSIDEASRQTRIRAEYLSALEHEQFDRLLGPVYARAFLRSYSTYLGLDADKVLTVYNRHFGAPHSSLPERRPGPAREAAAGHLLSRVPGRNHPSWRFLTGIALLVLSALAAAGLLSRRSSPVAQGLPVQRSLLPSPATVTLAIRANRPVRAVIRTDRRIAFQGLLREDEAKSFVAQSSIAVTLSRGGRAVIMVNGDSLGAPGNSRAPYSGSFGPGDYGGGAPGDSSPG